MSDKTHAMDWPDAFLRNFSRSELQREDYLLTVHADGRLYCVACDAYITGESKKSHAEFHIEELNEILDERALQATERRSAGLRAYHAKRKTVEPTQGVTLPQDALEHGRECPCDECVEAFS